jgi:hypothetical protein
VRSLVPELYKELLRPGVRDEGMRHLPGAYDDLAVAAALHAGAYLRRRRDVDAAKTLLRMATDSDQNTSLTPMTLPTLRWLV